MVATDPHVKVPSVVGLDQASATSALQASGSRSWCRPRAVAPRPGTVLKISPGADDTAVRGDTVTLTVSSGPKQVNVPNMLTVGPWRRDRELEDRGFAVNVLTGPSPAASRSTPSSARSPAGGQAAEGSTITITVGVKKRKAWPRAEPRIRFAKLISYAKLCRVSSRTATEPPDVTELASQLRLAVARLSAPDPPGDRQRRRRPHPPRRARSPPSSGSARSPSASSPRWNRCSRRA